MVSVYGDCIYRNKMNGGFYTHSFLKNVLMTNPKDDKDFTLVEDALSTIRNETVRCCYSQLFFDNSALILCNKMGERESLYEGLENGSLENYYDGEGNECDEEDAEESCLIEIYQFFIIDSQTAEWLEMHTDEIIFYDSEYDLYILGVTHFGTMWSGVAAEFKNF